MATGESFENTQNPIHDIYAREDQVRQRFGRLLTLVSEITETADGLGMLDDQVFHSLDLQEEGNKLTVASDRLLPRDHYNNNDYLSFVVNRTKEDSLSHDEGLIFATEFLVGVKPKYKNISATFDFVRLTDDGDDFLSGKKMPGVIWGAEDDELGIFRGKKFKIRLPRNVNSYKVSDSEVIEAQINHAEYLLGALSMLGAATEDQRTPYRW